MILGLALLSATPVVRDQVQRLNISLRDPLLALVDGIARRVNLGLASRLDSRGDVLVVDGFEVWGRISNPAFLDGGVPPVPQARAWLARWSV